MTLLEISDRHSPVSDALRRCLNRFAKRDPYMLRSDQMLHQVPSRRMAAQKYGVAS
jgi:hypothetical protein